MAIIPEGKYVTDDCMQTLIQLVKNQFSASLNNTIITRMSKSAYEALQTKDSNTVYYVTDISTGKVECYLGDTKISGEGGGGDEVYGIPFNVGIMAGLGNVLLIEELYTSLSIVTTISMFDYNFQNAEYDDDYGTLTPGGTQYPSTLDYIPLNGVKSIKITAYDTGGSGLYWCAYLYDANKSYLKSASSSASLLSWADNSTTRTIPTTATYIRFMFRNSGRTALAPSGVREAWYQVIAPDVTPL